MRVLDAYHAALQKRAQEEKKKAQAAKEMGDERAHSIHLMQESMLGEMLWQIGRTQHEGKRPGMMENLIQQLEKEAEKQRALGDFDAADRAKIKGETIRFALNLLKEEEKREGTENDS